MFTKGENIWIFIRTILCRHLKLQIDLHNLSNTGPFILSCGVGNFGKISSACEQREIQ
jgi:hypothetical protein